jgi:phosphoglycolate phosphatase
MSMQFPLAVKAVMIDLDGTLLDTAEDLADAASAMLRDLAMPPVELAEIKGYIGNGVSRLVKRCLTRDLDAEPEAVLFERALQSYQKHYGAHVSRKSRPFPGVVEGMQRLQHMGFKLACVTNKAEQFTLPLLKDTGLLSYFDIVVSGDSLPKKKPDPLPLLHAAQYFAVAPADMLLIGDSLNDTIAARAAGCPVFCVPYGYNRGRPVTELDLDAVVPSLLAATELLALKA